MNNNIKNKDNKTEQKTNVIRILNQANISYDSYCYVNTEAENGREVAAILGLDPCQVFKTLVTSGKSGAYFVFVIPVNKELNLKKAAKAVDEKSVEMIKQKQLLPLTGYVHGGCSPIGMKKSFVTVIDETAVLYEKIIFSAGKIGYQVEVNLDDLKKVIDFDLSDITD